MEITITIENEDGETVFTAHCKSVDSAIAELGRYERHFKPKEETV